jgi:hypothetical protein
VSVPKQSLGTSEHLGGEPTQAQKIGLEAKQQSYQETPEMTEAQERQEAMRQ